VADDRWLGDDALALERELLRAAVEERPPAGARRRGLAALGLLSVVAPSTAAAACAPAVGLASAAGPALGWPALAPWGLVLGLSVTVGVVGALVVDGVTHRAEPRFPRAPAVASVSAAPLATATARPPSPDPAAPPPAVGTTAPPPSGGRLVARAPAGAHAVPSIRQEVELLDQARGALARGASAAALVALGRYDERFPRGELREEAAVLRIEALRARGDDRAAAAAARHFAARYPASAHRERLNPGQR